MEDKEKKVVNESPKKTNFYSLSAYQNVLSTVKTNMSSGLENATQKMLNQRQEKSTLYPGQGMVLSIETNDETPQKYGCYMCLVDTQRPEDTAASDASTHQYIISFVTDHEEILNLFRSDLDRYCLEINQQLKSDGTINRFRSDLDRYCLEINQQLKSDGTINSERISLGALSLLENWFANSIGYLLRCVQALQDNIKFLIYSALLDNKLITSGGTDELQSDIQRFYSACSLSDILSQLKESSVPNTGSDSETSSIDMLMDMDQPALETQGIVTVSITSDSVKLDANGSNKFCEDWANALHRPDCQNNPARLKQIVEAFKLKFIQTMNTLKRILREAENDYYALYRSYVFLRNSGNSEILLHYVALEAATDVKDVLRVLQDFIKEQQT